MKIEAIEIYIRADTGKAEIEQTSILSPDLWEAAVSRDAMVRIIIDRMIESLKATSEDINKMLNANEGNRE